MILKSFFFVLGVCSAHVATAMHNGVLVVDASSFDEMLKRGTQEDFEKWVKDNNGIDLNTRCIKVENYIVAGKTKFMYPIERVIGRYARALKSLTKLLTILIAQQVPIDGYDDFNPLSYSIGAKFSKDIVIGVYNLGADPQKKFGGNNAITTAQERTHELLQEEKSKERNPDHERIRDLTELLELFKAGRQTINSFPDGSCNAVAAISTKQNAATVQTSSNTIQQHNHIPVAQNSQIAHRQRLFSLSQVAGIAVVSMFCGVGLKMGYDWYVSENAVIDADGEQ